MKEASHQTTIAALRGELGQKEDENARAVAQNIALQTTVQERHAYITLMTATFKEDVERLRESENAATCDHSSLEHRLQQAAKEVKELRAEQVRASFTSPPYTFHMEKLHSRIRSANPNEGTALHTCIRFLL
jgi:chromosome segregation ATPase